MQGQHSVVGRGYAEPSLADFSSLAQPHGNGLSQIVGPPPQPHYAGPAIDCVDD